jgi:hypothetical protein
LPILSSAYLGEPLPRRSSVFEDGVPRPREVDKLSADVETLCYDWRRMRSVIERIARVPWWDLHTLCCSFCHAPFEVSAGECTHEIDCVYERCCQIAGIKALALPNQAALEEWKRERSQSEESASFML